VTARETGERHARLTLSFLARPGDPVIGALLRSRTPAEILAVVTRMGEARRAGLRQLPDLLSLAAALREWRQRQTLLPSPARLAAWQTSGLRLTLSGPRGVVVLIRLPRRTPAGSSRSRPGCCGSG